MKPEKVYLQELYKWECPDCGNINIEDAPAAELSPDERKKILLEMGANPETDTSELCAVPTSVACYKCRKVFPVMQPEDLRFDDSGDDDEN
jgi:hypothetical protein